MVYLRVIIATTIAIHCAFAYPGEEPIEIGTLAGDVQNWAMLIQNYILQVRKLEKML